MNRIAKVAGNHILVTNVTEECDDVWSGIIYDVGKYGESFKREDIVYFKKENVTFIPFPKGLLPDINKFYAIKYYEILACITVTSPQEKKIPGVKTFFNGSSFGGFSVF